MIIGKFKLSTTDVQTVEISEPANILSVIEQRDEIVLYAEMKRGAPTVKKQICIIGTGNPMPEYPGRFIGTVSTEQGSLIWHVYDRTEA